MVGSSAIATRSSRSARLAATEPHEISVSVIAGGFSQSGFFVRLLVGHSIVDSFENLLFRETGIFQAADFRGAHGREALQVALKDDLDGSVSEPDQPEHHRVATNRIELIGAGKLEHIGIGIASASQ